MANMSKENTNEKKPVKLLPLEDMYEKAAGWLAYDIVWDTNGQPNDLPTVVEIEDESMAFDDVTKYLAEKYGRSVYSLGIRPLTRKDVEKKNNVIPFPA